MGNVLWVQAADPNAYPIIKRSMRQITANKDITGFQIKVMSYNVLADRLASLKHFGHTTRSILSLQFRGPRIITEIRESNADVLCLQEVDRLDFYEPMLNALGYSLVHYGRPGLFRGEGIAIAYKPETFKILEKETIDFDDHK